MISSLNESPLKKERDELSTQLLLETAQYPVLSIKDIRFFLNQFRKGDINDPKYRQGLADMHVNKISLYDDKMTILCNTQDGHFDVDIKEVSSLKGQLAEIRGVTLPGINFDSSFSAAQKKQSTIFDGTLFFWWSQVRQKQTRHFAPSDLTIHRQ